MPRKGNFFSKPNHVIYVSLWTDKAFKSRMNTRCIRENFKRFYRKTSELKLLIISVVLFLDLSELKIQNVIVYHFDVFIKKNSIRFIPNEQMDGQNHNNNKNMNFHGYFHI